MGYVFGHTGLVTPMVQLFPGQDGGPSTWAHVFCTFVHAWLLHMLQSLMYCWHGCCCKHAWL